MQSARTTVSKYNNIMLNEPLTLQTPLAINVMGDSLHLEIFVSNKLFVAISTREAAIKLK